MKRASLSLDLIFSIAALLLVVTMLTSFSLSQVERTQFGIARFRAESVAMQVGSAVNRFAAISPEYNSLLSLDLNIQPQNPASFLQVTNCNVSFSGSYVEVYLGFAPLYSNQDKIVFARYPTVTTRPSKEFSCQDSVHVEQKVGGLNIYE